MFVSPSEADSLIRRAVATGVVRRHGERLDVAYLEHTLRPICELAEDMAPLEPPPASALRASFSG